jgi:hypothetical protein
MTSSANFEEMLTGGHPNSLGNTVEVVDIVLKNNQTFNDLYLCYFSKDPIVRLRVSNAMKRICKEQPQLLVPYINKFLSDISKIDQASTQWTLAQLFLWLQPNMTTLQLAKAKDILKTNLQTSTDWIVQNTTIETLASWAKTDAALHAWLLPHLQTFAKSNRKSVAGRAKKMLQMLQNNS